MPTLVFRFEIRTSENGQGGMFTKSLIAATAQEAWKDLVNQMSSAGFLNIVTEIKRI